MSSGKQQIDRTTLQSLLALDEQLRSGGGTESPWSSSTGADSDLLRIGAAALQTLEAAIPRRSGKMPSWAPQAIGRFQLQSVLGAGGFAVVYLAHDPQLNREVALKVPRPHALIQPLLRQRFVTEARAAARLDHPHILPVFEAGEDGDLPYIACTLCKGPTLADWLSSRTTPLLPRITADVVRNLADALQYSHQQGILHRDIKPGNVLLFPQKQGTPEEFPFIARIGDFGLAKLLEDPRLDSVTSELIGTPRFMAPEMLGDGARTTSVAADIYAIGAVLYAMLTGQAPFGSASLVESIRSITTEDPPAPELFNRSVDRDLSLICLKCLEKTPSQRYASAGELRDDLDRFLNGQCVRARQTPLPVRIRKWSRRHPVAAAMATVSVIFVMTIGVMAIRYTSSLKNLQEQLQIRNSQLRDRVHELNIAVEMAKESQLETSAERTRTAELLQMADINLAGRVWRQGDARGAVNLLERWISLRQEGPLATSAAEIALSYLWNRATVDFQPVAQTTQAVWWIHADRPGQRLLLAGSEGRIEFVPVPPDDQEQSSQTQSELGSVLSGLKASQDELSSVTLSDDRTLLASTGDDGKVRVWKVMSDEELDANSLTLLHELTVVEQERAHAVLFLPGTHQIVVCARTPNLTVWDAESGMPLRDVMTQHPRFVESMVFSPDRTQLATAGADGLIEVFRVPDLTTMAQLNASEKGLSMTAFSRDGRMLVCGGGDRVVRLFSLATGNEVLQYTSLSGISAIVCNSSNQVLAGDRDGVLTLFQIPDDFSSNEPAAALWRPLKRWGGHNNPVSAISWLGSLHSGDDPSGTWISADRGGVVGAWNIGVTLSTRGQLPSAGIDALDGLPVLLPIGSRVLQGTRRGIDVMDIDTLDPVTKRPVPSPVKCLAVIHEGHQIFAGDEAGHIHCLGDITSNLSGTEVISVFSDTAVKRISVCPNANRLAAVSADNQVAVVDIPSRSVAFRAERSTIASLTPDGEFLIHAAPVADDLHVVRISDGAVVAFLKGHHSTVSKIEFTSDGTHCITTSHDRTICLWDLRTHTRVQQLTGHTSPIRCLAVSAHSDLIATGDDEGVIRLWDVSSGRELTELDERVPRMLGLQFIPEGTALIAWDAERRLHFLSM